MDWNHLLFSFEGRVNRAKYWLVAVILVAVNAVALIAAIFIGFSFLPTALAWIIIGAIVAAMIYIGFAVGAKRLHDRDKSAWWLLLYYVVPGLLGGFAGESYEGTNLILNLIGHAISLWALIDLGFLRGTVGDNQYGPDPLAKA